MKIKYYLFQTFILVIPLLLISCASRMGNDALGGVAGAATGAILSKGDLGYTALGAVGGIAISELSQAGARKNDQRIAANAYKQGAADNVKQLYWAKERALGNQKKTPETRYALFPIIDPPRTNNGVVFQGQTNYVRVVER